MYTVVVKMKNGEHVETIIVLDQFELKRLVGTIKEGLYKYKKHGSIPYNKLTLELSAWSVQAAYAAAKLGNICERIT